MKPLPLGPWQPWQALTASRHQDPQALSAPMLLSILGEMMECEVVLSWKRATLSEKAYPCLVLLDEAFPGRLGLWRVEGVPSPGLPRVDLRVVEMGGRVVWAEGAALPFRKAPGFGSWLRAYCKRHTGMSVEENYVRVRPLDFEALRQSLSETLMQAMDGPRAVLEAAKLAHLSPKAQPTRSRPRL